MTHPNQRDSDDASDRMPRSRAAFRADLEALVARARDAGVDLQGAYDVRSPAAEQPDYTVEISAIAKRPERSLIE